MKVCLLILKVQTTLDGFKTIEQGGGRSRRTGGKAKRRDPRSPPITTFMKTAKPFTPRGSPPPEDGKIKARQPTPTEEGGGSMVTNFKCKLKF